MKNITCISDIYYVIGQWFIIIMWTLAFITLPFAMECWESIMTFLMCAGIAFVGCAANYKDTTEYPVHYIAAIFSGICSIIFTIHVCPYLLYLFFLFAPLIILDKKRRLLWCEIPCFLIIYIEIIINLLK